MKLLNYNELKTLLLEERDKIPLTVPGARYELYMPQPNRHGESMRGGIRIALRCMERCQPLTLDDLRPKGRWIGTGYDGYADGCLVYDLWECSECRAEFGCVGDPPPYEFCPSCGADMRGGGER